MRKFLKYIKFILITLIVLISLHCAGICVFTPLIQKYIYNKTGYKLKFDNFYISPLGLTLENLKADDMFAANKVTFKINPLKLFKYIASPVDWIDRINIPKLEIYLNSDINIINSYIRDIPIEEKTDDKKEDAISKESINLLKILNSDINIKNRDKNFLNPIFCLSSKGTVDKKEATKSKKSNNLLKIVNSDINIINRDKIVLNSIFYIRDIPIKINSRLEKKTENIFTVSSLFTAKDKANLCLRSKGTIDFSSLDISQNIEIEQMLYKGFDFSGSSCSFSKSASNYNANFTGDSGCFSFSSSENSAIDIKSEIDLSKINKKLAGNVQIKFNKRHNKRDIKLDIINLNIFGSKYGNFKLLGVRNNDNIYNMSCMYGHDKKIKIAYTKEDGKHKAKIMVKNQTAGVIEGDFKTGKITGNINNVNIGGVPISGYMEFQGHLDTENNIKGVIKSTGTRVAGLSLGSISADAVISTEKLEIFNLKSDNGIKASISAKFKENKLSGDVDLKNINIKGIYPEISGFLNSHVKFSGELDSPHIIISATVREGKYLAQSFSLTSKLEYEDGTFKINNVRLKSPFELEFSGYVNPYVKNGKYCPRIFLNAASACIKTVKLNDVESEIEFSDDKIIINSAYAKVSNGEVKVDKGFFNIKDGVYNLDLSLINVPVGSADIFSKVKLSGKRIKEKNKIAYNGSLKFNDLWINKCKLSSSCFDYSLKDKAFEFSQKSNDINKYNSLSSVVSRDTGPTAKFGIKGSNIDLSFVNDILNLPDNFFREGSVDIKANLYGNIDNPQWNLSISSTRSGYVADVPYDNFNTELSFDNNCVCIKASVSKQNELSMYIDGNFPLRFDKATAETKQKEPVGISYKIDDRKLHILKYLSNKYIEPKSLSGEMSFNGKILGTYEKPSNSGELSITGCSFKTKYLSEEVKDMSVKISLDKNIIKIGKFNFKSGNGELKVSGEAELEKFKIGNFNIEISTDKNGIPLCIPQLLISKTLYTFSPLTSKILSKILYTFSPLNDKHSSGKLILDKVNIRGTPLKPKVSGRIALKNAQFVWPDNEELEDLHIPVPEDTEFDLKLIANKNIRLETSRISMSINGLVHIRGTYAEPEIKGVIKNLNGEVIGYCGADAADAKGAEIKIDKTKISGPSSKDNLNTNTQNSNSPETNLQKPRLQVAISPETNLQKPRLTDKQVANSSDTTTTIYQTIALNTFGRLLSTYKITNFLNDLLANAEFSWSSFNKSSRGFKNFKCSTSRMYFIDDCFFRYSFDNESTLNKIELGYKMTENSSIDIGFECGPSYESMRIMVKLEYRFF
ncbi:hypothetical protein AGMMS50222_02380 [Endomicrobiia bacterium]|nr:hypothetical protein AGMMS49556_05350 [Endomicrobiia bacterium]GHT73987.1 hypothetical protein AGMMS50222_02380 [Endomicrobiia bacterium]